MMAGIEETLGEKVGKECYDGLGGRGELAKKGKAATVEGHQRRKGLGLVDLVV